MFDQSFIARPSHQTAETSAVARVLAFRSFRVFPAARRVLRGDREIELGGRAFDLLVALLKARGQVVSKSLIMREVWPSTTVDECNLRFQMATLRKALGCDRDVIKTIPGRGYLIIDEVDERGRQASSSEDLATEEIAEAAPQALDRRSSPAPRLMELEAENIRLRLAIARLTLSRLVAVPEPATAAA